MGVRQNMTPLLLPVNGGENVHLMIPQKLHMQTTAMNCKSFCVCVKRITLCYCLCSSSPSCLSSPSRDFASLIWNIEKFEAKNNFTDHQTANIIYGFRNLVPVLKIHDCYLDTQKSEQHFLPVQAIATRREQCWCKQPTSNSFETLKTVYTYLNCTRNQLLYCWKSF